MMKKKVFFKYIELSKTFNKYSGLSKYLIFIALFVSKSAFAILSELLLSIISNSCNKSAYS